MANKLKIMVVAGEPSGDGHGAKLVHELRQMVPDSQIEFFGSAGPLMRTVGVEATVAADELSIVGLAEIGRALPMFLRAMGTLKSVAAERRPDVAILIDFPEFNLKLAKALKKQGTKVVYYISPQLWAWRKYRVKTIRKYVDLLLTILPFEREWYAQYGVENVEYVGNPLAMQVAADITRDRFRSELGLDQNVPLIALLPGSRQKEIVRILPVLVGAALKINESLPDAQFIIGLANGRHRMLVEQALAKYLPAETVRIPIVEGQTYNALNASDAAAVTSGTATLEAGIIGTPMAIVYKTSRLNYSLIKPLVSVEHFGLINLIAGKRLVTELIQGEFTPNTLSDEILRLLDPVVNNKMRLELKAAAEKLGEGGASRRAAEAILRLLGRK